MAALAAVVEPEVRHHFLRQMEAQEIPLQHRHLKEIMVEPDFWALVLRVAVVAQPQQDQMAH
jgi:hypothetical protein